MVFYYDIWKNPIKVNGFDSIEEAVKRLGQFSYFVEELKELVFALKESIDHIVEPILANKIPGLYVHVHYTRDQLLSLTKLHSPTKKFSWREGTLHNKDMLYSMMMVTLNKSEKDFSPSIQYEDYAVSENLFHWQSQNCTLIKSETGQRYINHDSLGWDMLLFARDSKKDSFGLTDTYCFLGASKLPVT